MDRNVTVIVEAANIVAARDLMEDPNSFSVQLGEVQGWDQDAQRTHYAMSGYIPADKVELMEVSVSPMFNVTNNEGTDFHTIIAGRSPRLYMRTEPL